MERENLYFILHSETMQSQGYTRGARFDKDGLAIEAGGRMGIYLSQILESPHRGHVWERVCAELDIPQGTQSVFYLIASDSKEKIHALREAVANDAISDESRTDMLVKANAFTVINSADFLLFDVIGKYLLLAVELYAVDEMTPHMQSITIYAKEESFLKYLPEIYGERGAFLDRFLRLFSIPFLETEREIDFLDHCMNPQAVSGEALFFLACNIGIPHAELWREDALRKLMCQHTYAKKGTLAGLQELITLFAGYSPCLIECFRMECGIHENEQLYYGTQLIIALPQKAMEAFENLDALHMVVQSFIPFSVSYKIIALQNKAILSGYTYLNQNAMLSGFSEAQLGTNAAIGYSVLGE